MYLVLQKNDTHLDQNGHRFSTPMFGAEPSGAFWKQEDSNKLDDWHYGLDSNRDSPCYISCILDGSVNGPGRDNRPNVP